LRGQCAGIVRFHQTAITYRIGGQDRCRAALDALFSRAVSSVSAIPAGNSVQPG